MKNCKIVMGVVALTALCAVKGAAQINYQNGDLLAGFRTAGGNTDVIVDLGPISNFQQPNIAPISFSGVSSALTSALGGVSGTLYWSVFGVNDTTLNPSNGSVSQADANTLWTTLPRSNPATKTGTPFVGGLSASQGLVAGDIETIASSTSSASGSPVTAISAGIVSVNNTTGFGYSPSIGTTVGGNLGNFNGDWGYNIENIGSGTSDLYQSDPGNSFTKKAAYLGNFSLDPSGNFTYNAVPEPATWAMVGTGAMSLLAFGRFRNRK